MHIFYRPEQNALPQDNSPSANKPQQVVEDWLQHGLILPQDIVAFEPLTATDLALAHAPEYVAGVLSGRFENGFGNFDPSVAAALPFTCGSFFAAARQALNSVTITVSPTSGFHHASYNGGAGFCTFNGLMLTAIKLHQAGEVQSVLIVDGDGHYGDGTQNIIDYLGCGTWIRHLTRMRDYGNSDEFQKAFSDVCRSYEKTVLPDLVLYQAGADAWEHDPLSVGEFSFEELALRDRTVFRWVIKHHIPLAWNLAGGYARDANGGIEPVLRIHRQTLQIARDCAEPGSISDTK